MEDISTCLELVWHHISIFSAHFGLAKNHLLGFFYPKGEYNSL